MSGGRREERNLGLAELPRPKPSTSTYRERGGATLPTDHPGLSLDFLGIGIFVALLLVGALAVVSAQGVGEEGLGVAMMCGAVLLVVAEVVHAIDSRNVPASPSPHSASGDSDD